MNEDENKIDEVVNEEGALSADNGVGTAQEIDITVEGAEETSEDKAEESESEAEDLDSETPATEKASDIDAEAGEEVAA